MEEIYDSVKSLSNGGDEALNIKKEQVRLYQAQVFQQIQERVDQLNDSDEDYGEESQQYHEDGGEQDESSSYAEENKDESKSMIISFSEKNITALYFLELIFADNVRKHIIKKDII